MKYKSIALSVSLSCVYKYMNNGLTQKFSSISKLEYLVAFMSVIVDLKSYKVSFLIFHYTQKRTAKILFPPFHVVSTKVEVFL